LQEKPDSGLQPKASAPCVQKIPSRVSHPQTLDEARRVAQLCAARRHPCELKRKLVDGAKESEPGSFAGAQLR
jgi:hypothetical protein